MYVHGPNSDVMWCHEVFCCVISHVFGAWRVLYVYYPILDLISDPKITHFHQAQSLAFYRAITYSHRGLVITIDRCWRLWVSQFFQCKAEDACLFGG